MSQSHESGGGANTVSMLQATTQFEQGRLQNGSQNGNRISSGITGYC